MVTRVLLLFSVSWVSHLATPLFALSEHEVSGRDLVFLATNRRGVASLSQGCLSTAPNLDLCSFENDA
jgi:predicted tellurium resistance membrane protein TerC